MDSLQLVHRENFNLIKRSLWATAILYNYLATASVFANHKFDQFYSDTNIYWKHSIQSLLKHLINRLTVHFWSVNTVNCQKKQTSLNPMNFF